MLQGLLCAALGALSVSAVEPIDCGTADSRVTFPRGTTTCGPEGYMREEVTLCGHEIVPGTGFPKNNDGSPKAHCIGLCKEKCINDPECGFYRSTGFNDEHTCHFWSDCIGTQEFPGQLRKTYNTRCDPKPAPSPAPQCPAGRARYKKFLDHSTCSCGESGRIEIIEPLTCPDSLVLPSGKHCIEHCQKACTENPLCNFYRSSGSGDNYECDLWNVCTDKMYFPDDEPRKTYAKHCGEGVTAVDFACGDDVGPECVEYDIPEENQDNIVMVIAKAERQVGVELWAILTMKSNGGEKRIDFGDRKADMKVEVGCLAATKMKLCAHPGTVKLNDLIVTSDAGSPLCLGDIKRTGCEIPDGYLAPNGRPCRQMCCTKTGECIWNHAAETCSDKPDDDCVDDPNGGLCLADCCKARSEEGCDWNKDTRQCLEISERRRLKALEQ